MTDLTQAHARPAGAPKITQIVKTSDIPASKPLGHRGRVVFGSFVLDGKAYSFTLNQIVAPGKTYRCWRAKFLDFKRVRAITFSRRHRAVTEAILEALKLDGGAA